MKWEHVAVSLRKGLIHGGFQGGKSLLVHDLLFLIQFWLLAVTVKTLNLNK